jgi:hypothetical protein
LARPGKPVCEMRRPRGSGRLIPLGREPSGELKGFNHQWDERPPMPRRSVAFRAGPIRRGVDLDSEGICGHVPHPDSNRESPPSDEAMLRLEGRRSGDAIGGQAD